jgi:class 3 adenylate cyclase
MPNQVTITCFTDLEGSTSLNERLGNESYVAALSDHLRVGRILVKQLGGQYIKNVGDAHMVRFDLIESAVGFALQLQEYYRDSPCVRRLPLSVRVAMYLGVVEATNNDIFGTGVNRAARAQGETAAGEVTINKALADSIEQAWGPQKMASYLQSIGERDLKGIDSKQELFKFDWQQHGHDYPETGLSKLVYDHLRRAKVEPSLVNISTLSRPGIVIWPVVPRDLPTAIHKGQTEIVRLLAFLGWRIKLLIADCGARNNYNRPYSSAFSLKLEKYAANRGVSPIEIL